MDESSEEEREKLSGWVSQTSQPTTRTSRGFGVLSYTLSCSSYTLRSCLSSPPFKVCSVAPSYSPGPSPAPLQGSMLVPANAGGLRGKQYAILCTKCSVGIWAVDVEKFAVLCVEGCELKEIESSKFQNFA